MNLLSFFKRTVGARFPRPASKGRETLPLLILLVMIGMASFLPNLLGHDLWEPDELRCAEVAREMVVDGHWIVPHLEGEVYPDKPPLFFWLIALFSYCFGGLNTFSIRLPSALAGIGGMLIIYFFGKRLGNRWTGLLAALILAAMPCYFAMSITARMDILLTFFVSAALYCFYLAYSKTEHRLQITDNRHFSDERRATVSYLLFYFLMGMGTLTKGPIGLLIPFLTVLSYLLVKGEWKRILQLRLASGFLVFAATVAAWLVPAVILGGRDYAYQILFHQNVDRYIGGWNHENTFTYYFKVLPVILMPWTPLLPAVFGMWILEWRMRMLGDARLGGRNNSAFRIPHSALPMMWLITTFVFLSCSGSRGRIYLLPVLPAVALGVGLLLDALVQESGVRSQESGVVKRLSLISYLIMPALLIAGAITAPAIIKHDRAASLFAASVPILSIIGAGSIACLVLGIWKAYKASFAIFVATVLIASFSFCFHILPIISPERSVKTLFAEIGKVTKPGDELRTYLITGASYSYYWGSVIKKISTEEELRQYLRSNERAFCLIKERHYEKIKQTGDSPISVVLKMRASGIRFVLVTAESTSQEPGLMPRQGLSFK